jgi:hypothetical protein
VFEVKNYGTLEFDDETNLEQISFPDLGREIYWENKKFGFIGDFNGNGKEELYFYESSGWGFNPLFYEFNGQEFVKILGYPRSFAIISHVDKENKIISFEGRGGERNDNVSFKWNDETSMYEKIE